MSLFTVFKISSQGMTAQRERLEAASTNLANANTTRTTNGGPYQRRDVLLTPQKLNDEWNQALAGGFGDQGENMTEGVKSEIVMGDSSRGDIQHMPWHPDADANGNVLLPDVDPLEETVNMMSAARSFEANATVFTTAKELARISLNLGDA